MSLSALHQYLDEFRAQRGRISVLEAGCGRRARFDYTGASRIVGIDISPQQLANNAAIDEGIVGDVQTHPISDTFDLIVAWDLLEHLADPTAALDNLALAVKPGGVLMIGIPNVASVKGW